MLTKEASVLVMAALRKEQILRYRSGIHSTRATQEDILLALKNADLAV